MAWHSLTSLVDQGRVAQMHLFMNINSWNLWNCTLFGFTFLPFSPVQTDWFLTQCLDVEERPFMMIAVLYPSSLDGASFHTKVMVISSLSQWSSCIFLDVGELKHRVLFGYLALANIERRGGSSLHSFCFSCLSKRYIIDCKSSSNALSILLCAIIACILLHHVLVDEEDLPYIHSVFHV